MYTTSSVPVRLNITSVMSTNQLLKEMTSKLRLRSARKARVPLTGGVDA